MTERLTVLKKLAVVAAFAALVTGSFAQEAVAPAVPESQKEAAAEVAKPAEEDLKTQISRLRGKLLYQRNKARKFETGVLEADEDIKARLDAMEAERRSLMIAAQPKLEGVYNEIDKLVSQLDELVAKDKKK